MFKTSVKAISIAVLAGSGTYPLVAAHAQEKTLALEEIIVTARKREESVQDVPVSVTALSAAELRRSSIRDLRDVTAYVPNLLVDKVTALQGGAAIAIRGVSYQEIDKSLDPGIGVLLDDVYLGTNAGQILENFDLERLEVLRGPQGTLFGKNTIGGALAIFRTAPTKELGGKVQGTLGDFGRQDVRGLLNLPMTENGGVKLWASKLHSDGYIENTTINDDVGSQRYENAGATVAYDFTDDFALAFTYERTQDKSDVGAWANDNKYLNEVPYDSPDAPAPADLAGLLPWVTPGTPYTGSRVGFRDFDPGSDDNHVSQNGRNTGNSNVDYVNLTLNYTLGDWYLTSISGYIDRNENSRLEYDANSIPFLDVESDTDYSQYSQEFRVNGEIGDVELTSGLYYWYSDYDTHSVTNDLFEWLNGFPDGSVGTISQHGKTESYAAFTSADWSVTEKITLSAGVRYTWEEKTMKPVGQAFYLPNGTQIDASGNPTNVPPVALEADKDWDKWSPRLGAQYQFTDDMMAYASFSQGFKSGGFFGRITLATPGSLRSFEPEEVDTYEIGLKSTWWQDRLRVNAAIFTSDYSDKQEEILVADAGGNVDTVVANASSATMEGAELEVSALVYEGLTVFVQGGYLNAEYDEFRNDIPGLPPGTLPADASVLEMRNAPKYTFGTGLNYVHSLFGHSQMSYDVVYNWRDDYVTIFNNDPLGEVDSAGFWNANIDYTYKEMLTVSVYGRNLGDERYNRTVTIPPIATFSQWNEPRNYGVMVTYDF
ncbi:MAG: TonB-dependent receptor [Halioglobus sp.]|nr:TonB-dependent receptor [Halioglobus sp.]